jgi:hypothetical protein
VVQAGGRMQVHHLVVLNCQVMACPLKVCHLQTQKSALDNRPSCIIEDVNSKATTAAHGT